MAKAVMESQEIGRPDAAAPPAMRKAERSRQQLIAATLDSIAEDGITDTTVSRIIARAGLSRGMIHLHFGGKDNLLVAAAEFFCLAYYDEIERQVAPHRGDPAGVVAAVVRADLSEALLNVRSARIWHAFRGAAHQSEGIARFSDTRDGRMRDMLMGAFAELARGAPDAPQLARDATHGTLALLEGMWTDFQAHPDAFSRDAAARIITRFQAGLFPAHFAVG